MKAISQGDNTYDIFDDSLRVYDQLPAQSYTVKASQGRGFYLAKYVDMEITEPKVYGVHESKIKKVMTSFGDVNRSLGVILSGDKGIGKSLFAKMLAAAAIEDGMPVIVVNTYIPGIAAYLEGIEQEVMVLFDEFDKTFGEVKSKDGEASPQANLLTLFDGLSGGKKLFVITCNELRSLNEYLINRPGRFHYHFRFDYPSQTEIRQYMQDKLHEDYYGEIDKVIEFAAKVNLNYDCLRAIAFELNYGISFEEAIKDINIINWDSEEYTLTLVYKNGFTAKRKDYEMDLFSDEEVNPRLFDSKGYYFADVKFAPTATVFDMGLHCNVIYPENLEISYYYYDDEDDDDYKELIELAKSCEKAGVSYMRIDRKRKRGIHYVA